MKYNKLYQVKQKLALLRLLTSCLSYEQQMVFRLYEGKSKLSSAYQSSLVPLLFLHNR